jgi:hypothetical protein
MTKPAEHDRIPFRFLGGTGTFNAGASVWVYALCLLLGLPLVGVYLVHAPCQWWRARSWVETPCQIITAEMVPDGKANWTYSEHVVYEYQWEQQRHRNDKLQLLNYSIRREVEAHQDDLRHRYPPGGESRCYVNPLNPTESILDRDLSPGDFLYLPFGVILTGVGIAGFWIRWQRRRPAALPGKPDE